ncbi:transcriptional regulator [Empedobacter brevis NBRC 14943 = ATCC 43319]|jgi:transcriptional regulator with XRE-family HTH domain|uniref:Transcriptional regulator n=1 Tax=Empedobacter brevis NBRC 14943 = ATCC 43319 TaxID=1218108 RepID=A0A511NKQ1_9FLAO|nr:MULTISPECIES: helix-turn-helix transcriptional regulator [Weeksellaceae]MDM1555386.1 helix-turn-helix transcriptional regulator [Chryseobacterium indologenes]GEM53380.1 transcriptional regulator [Empedobacter brevis NBRC 14943 = ATCC 43319]
MEQRDFGIKVRQLREQKGLLLRQIAAALEVDTALVSKIERGERKASKEQIMKIAELLEINPDELLVIWLSDKIVDMLQEEPLAYKVLKNSENRLKNK